MHDEYELMSRFRQGDEGAFEKVHELYHYALLLFAKGITRHDEDIKDIVNEAFGKLWKRREMFQTLTNVKAFLYITVRNDCISYLRQKKKEGGLSTESPEPHAHEALQSELMAEIFQFIRTSLPTGQRDVMMLFLQGYSTAEIAKALSFAEGSVRMLRSRAVEQIRLFLRKRGTLPLLLPLAAAMVL